MAEHVRSLRRHLAGFVSQVYVSARRLLHSFLCRIKETVENSAIHEGSTNSHPSHPVMDIPWASVLLLGFLAVASYTPSSGAEGTAEELLRQGDEAIRAAQEGLARTRAYFDSSVGLRASVGNAAGSKGGVASAWGDCVQLYEDSDLRLQHLATWGGGRSVSDAHTWLSGAITGHRTCMEGYQSRACPVPGQLAENVTRLLTDALRIYASLNDFHDAGSGDIDKPHEWNSTSFHGVLASWDPSTAQADMVVAKDGSGNYKTINEAVAAARSHWKQRRDQRIIVHVKAGVYAENVEISRGVRNLMLIGEGIDKTVVTGSRSVAEGYSTFRSATFGVSGDGFWARDMTFENAAGPEKHQAVALRVSADLAIFYRCSFRGYQDTLFVHSQRQFYRDCDVYGTIDFIFGNAAAVLQTCNIYVRRPMGHQSNVVTAQGRGSPYENTGISVHRSRVLPAGDFQVVKRSFSSFLGRPWQKYSRTVFMQTELDGLVSPKGWAEWSGSFALDTLYYAEYMNTGEGAPTANRVNWHGFHVLREPSEAMPFTVSKFIQGDWWISSAGVPFMGGL
ncbi:hypothetical protein Taro_043467 [Colocasia esculenta]|uniref:Pectinesterase n=1 Tax=Colocasia esculenta TaxID=4460 RepID=A0A843X457_COLES|nr:hypothetical protein [Colocasia esculenta]